MWYNGVVNEVSQRRGKRPGSEPRSAFRQAKMQRSALECETPGHGRSFGVSAFIEQLLRHIGEIDMKALTTTGSSIGWCRLRPIVSSAPVAQWIEHLPSKQRVRRSSRLRGANRSVEC